jgi:16S rRNA (cytosine967-C5)-methyltransferase
MTSLDIPREKALEILCRVEAGSFADPLLAAAREHLDGRDSAFVLELVYGVLRQRSHLDWILERFSAQPLSRTDPATRNLLRLGAYQMLFLDKVPVSAAVNTSTEIAKKHGRKSGYVNGLLRNLDRNRAGIVPPSPDDPVNRLAILYSHPPWLVRRWLKRFGSEQTETILRENNRPSRLVLRTNVLKTSREALKQSLETEGAELRETDYSPAALEILSSPGIQRLVSYQAGSFMIQDEAAQLVGMMLCPRPGEEVLDACAAPGGKATHLAELMNNSGRLLALESDPLRIEKIAENRDRLGLSIIKPLHADASSWSGVIFDKILIDAPCSGLGVLRRHPDGRWNKQESTIRERARFQRAILQNCAGLLKPGGALVYATCTTEPEENESIINEFLARTDGNFVLDDPRPFLPEAARLFIDDQGLFRTFPRDPALDGFFAARMTRKQ